MACVRHAHGFMLLQVLCPQPLSSWQEAPQQQKAQQQQQQQWQWRQHLNRRT